MNKKILLAGLLTLASVAGVVGTVGNAHKIGAEDVNTSLNALVTKYYHAGVYQKDTVIYLKDDATFELSSIFHAGVDTLERTTYYNDDALWMSRDDGKYSYYGTSGSDLVNAVVDTVGDTTGSKVVITGQTMEEKYYTLYDVKESAATWTLNEGVYSSTDLTLIEVFKGFTAPCYLGFNDTTSKYVDLVSVEIEETENGLELRLIADGTNDGVIDGADGDTTTNEVFSKATITYSHTGGEATTTEKAICEHCGEYYGDLLADPYVHIYLDLSWSGVSEAYVNGHKMTKGDYEYGTFYVAIEAESISTFGLNFNQSGAWWHIEKSGNKSWNTDNTVTVDMKAGETWKVSNVNWTYQWDNQEHKWYTCSITKVA